LGFFSQMARYTETFTVAKPLDAVGAACRLAVQYGQWKLMDDQGWALMGQEQADLLSRFFRYPIKFAIFLRTPEGEDGPIDVEMHGAIFGLGPFPRANAKKRIALLRRQIEYWLEQEDAGLDALAAPE
jgi:hypothetical protein